MSKNLIQLLIEAKAITEKDVEDYYKKHIENNKQTKILKQNNQSRFSKIRDGVLVEFDERDMIDGHYIVPDDVRVIGQQAFSNSKIKSIALNYGLAKIEFWAFSGSQLESIAIPDSVWDIGMEAFKFCHNLKRVYLPRNEHLVSLNGGIFKCCENLEYVHIPENIIISSEAFAGCPCYVRAEIQININRLNRYEPIK